MNRWVQAFRLRTLPLALSSIITGSAIAFLEQKFSAFLFFFAALTAILLQVLSNLANDYGDFIKGTDCAARAGPDRTMQSGLISQSEMLSAIKIMIFMTVCSGSTLLAVSLWNDSIDRWFIFILLGFCAIAAAIKYTMGHRPYGYIGLGDLFVFLFFGLAGVLGTYYLHTHSLDLRLLMPASALGLFSTAVLNVNNIRDHVADRQSGKKTLVVLLGIHKACIYHRCLNTGGLILATLYILPSANIFNYMYLLVAPLLLIPAFELTKRKDYASFDPYLKKQCIATFLFSILFSLGLNM